MDRRQQRDDDEQDHQGVDQPDHRSAQGADCPRRIEDDDIEQREELAVDQVREEADHFGAIAVRRDRCSEQIRQAHPGEIKLLRAGLDRRQQQCADESRQK